MVTWIARTCRICWIEGCQWWTGRWCGTGSTSVPGAPSEPEPISSQIAPTRSHLSGGWRSQEVGNINSRTDLKQRWGLTKLLFKKIQRKSTEPGKPWSLAGSQWTWLTVVWGPPHTCKYTYRVLVKHTYKTYVRDTWHSCTQAVGLLWVSTSPFAQLTWTSYCWTRGRSGQWFSDETPAHLLPGQRGVRGKC